MNARLLGKLEADVPAGGSAPMAVWRYDGGVPAEAGEGVTVFDWRGLGPAAAGSKLLAERNDDRGGWEVVAVECP